MLAEHEPAAVLADDEFAQTIANVPGEFARISTWPDAETGYPTVDELIHAAPADPPKPVERPGRLVVLTSGTTGTPKGARRPTPKGLGSAAAILDRIPCAPATGSSSPHRCSTAGAWPRCRSAWRCGRRSR